jgi:hypothetical protein
MALPTEDRRLGNGDGIVHNGKKSCKRRGIKKEAIEPKPVAQLFFQVVRHGCCYQGTVEGTPQYPQENGNGMLHKKFHFCLLKGKDETQTSLTSHQMPMLNDNTVSARIVIWVEKRIILFLGCPFPSSSPPLPRNIPSSSSSWSSNPPSPHHRETTLHHFSHFHIFFFVHCFFPPYCFLSSPNPFGYKTEVSRERLQTFQSSPQALKTAEIYHLHLSQG